MSEVDIANGALSALGQPAILSFEQPGEPASLVRRRYPIARDQLLTMHPWNFALQRFEIAADVAAPAFGFSRQYTLPADVLSVRALMGDGFNGAYAAAPNEDWRVEGRKLLSEVSSPARIIAIVRQTDAESFPPLFQRALELYLAMDIAEFLTDSTSKVQQVQQLFRRVLAEAKGSDAREGRPGRIDSSMWLRAHDRPGFANDQRAIVTG